MRGRFPFTFFNLVMVGLLFGAKQINLVGAAWLFGETAMLLTWVWVPSSSGREDNTKLLGTAYLLQVNSNKMTSKSLSYVSQNIFFAFFLCFTDHAMIFELDFHPDKV